MSSVARWERGAATPSPVMRGALARELTVSLDELAGLLDPVPDRAGSPDDRVPGNGPITEHRDTATVDNLIARLTSDAYPTFNGDPAFTGNLEEKTREWWFATPHDIPAANFSELSGHGEGRIGNDTIARIRNRVQALRNADDVLAGGDLHPVIRAELANTTRLLRAAEYGESVGRRLLAEIATLCELAGWSTADAGHDDAAEHYYLRGISAAHTAGDPVLGAHLISGLAYQLAESDKPGDALVLARSAFTRVEWADRRLTPTVRALLRARLAWALAKTGEITRARDEISRAREDHQRRAPDDPDPPWVYWLSTGEMEIIVGRCENAIGKPDRAQQRLSSALQLCDPRYAREYTLYTTWLAEAYLDMRNVDGASKLATQARDHDARISSAFSRRAVAGLTQRLARTAS